MALRPMSVGGTSEMVKDFYRYTGPTTHMLKGHAGQLFIIWLAKQILSNLAVEVGNQ